MRGALQHRIMFKSYTFMPNALPNCGDFFKKCCKLVRFWRAFVTKIVRNMQFRLSPSRHGAAPQFDDSITDEEKKNAPICSKVGSVWHGDGTGGDAGGLRRQR